MGNLQQSTQPEPYADRWGATSPYQTNPNSLRAIAFDPTRRNSQAAMADLAAKGAKLNNLLLILACGHSGC